MEGRPLSDDLDDTQVEVCVECGAAFFDFQDGEPRVLAERVIGSGSVAVRAAIAGTVGECPACGGPLHTAPYLGHGPAVLRCGSCGGCAATRAQLLELVALVDVEPLPPEPPTLLHRMLRSLGLLREVR